MLFSSTKAIPENCATIHGDVKKMRDGWHAQVDCKSTVDNESSLQCIISVHMCSDEMLYSPAPVLIRFLFILCMSIFSPFQPFGLNSCVSCDASSPCLWPTCTVGDSSPIFLVVILFEIFPFSIVFLNVAFTIMLSIACALQEQQQKEERYREWKDSTGDKPGISLPYSLSFYCQVICDSVNRKKSE